MIRFLCLVFLMLGICGCRKGANLNNKMLKYINERYDDEFVYLENGETKEILVGSKKYPDAKVTVKYSIVEGVESFNDNYLYFVYKDQTVEHLHDILSGVIHHDFKLYYGDAPGVGVREFTPDTSFERYISDITSRLRFTVVVAPGYEILHKAMFVRHIRHAFNNQSTVILVADLRFCDNMDIYESLNKQSLYTFLAAYKGPTLDMSLIGTEKEDFTWR